MKLRDRVQFRRRNDAPDSYGNVTDGTWVDLFTVWGGFTPEQSRERLEANRIESAVLGTLTVRSTSQTRTVTAADSVVIDGDAYQIRAIMNPDQRNNYLEMTVERGAAI